MFTGFRSDSKEPINVDAEALEIAEVGKQRISTFSGGVVIRRGDTVLKASVVKLIEDLGAKPGRKKAAGDAAPETTSAVKPAAEGAAGKSLDKIPFSRIEATGKVSVASGTQTVTGDTAVFNSTANTVVVAGHVLLRQGENHISGDRLTINLASGVARIEQSGGRIKGQFSPGDASLLGDKPKKDQPEGDKAGKGETKAGRIPVPQAKPGG
jgi:lipopolysaccharide export system protein LptA